MNTRNRLAACGLLAFGAFVSALASSASVAARAEPPRVVSMSPDHGDINVDPELTHIRVTFDQDMSPGGRSICGGGPNFPTITALPTWESARVIVIPVKLAPGTTYWMSMNCPSAQNFRSITGEAAVITPLSFQTAAPGVDPMPPVVLTAEMNRAAIEAMERAIETSYSYRDRVVQNWDKVFEASREELESATTRAAFARAAARMLGEAADPHVSLGVNNASFGTVRRTITPNYDPRRIAPTIVPTNAVADAPANAGLTQLNDISASGVINSGTSGAIGYILISSWPGDGELLLPVHDELTRMIDDGLRRIIVDVRSNGGGNELAARAFASRFTPERAIYSQNRIRDNAQPGGWLGPYKRVVQPLMQEARENPHAAAVIAHAGGTPPPQFHGRVVVVQGPVCMSSNESFLLMMRHGAQAVLMGETSAGSSGNPREHDLGNGVMLYLSSWEDMEPDGRVVEGAGIEPQVSVAFDWQAEKDTVIEAAIRWFDSP